MIKLSIIIINYNTPWLVYNCLGSIRDNLKIDFEVVLVDNGSKPELKIEKEELESILPPKIDYKLIELPENRGFGTGNNAGVKVAKGKYLWFLNSDTLLINNSIEKLLNFLVDNKKVGVASPVLYNDLACKKVQPYFFAKFQTLKNLIIRRNGPKTNFTDQEYFETDVVVGASLIIRKEIFNKLHGFDERIFMFFEDDDLCFRVKKLNYKVVVFCHSNIVHLQGKSLQNNVSRKKLYYRSQLYFWQKHYGFWPTLLMRILRWSYKILKSGF